MAARDRVFRVFVSSTFSDFVAERNALQERVYPALREYCRARGARFQAIDLRWGVSEEAAIDQQTMTVCLEELRRCQRTGLRPNFVVLLGDRYGWRPLPPAIEAGEFASLLAAGSQEERERLTKWYRRDDNAAAPEYTLVPREGEFEDAARWGQEEVLLRATLVRAARAVLPDLDPRRPKYEHAATHQEIHHGALQAEDAGRQVFCYFRSFEPAPRASDPGVGQFIDLAPDGTIDADARERLAALRKQLDARLGGSRIHCYTAPWPPTGEGGGLEAFCAKVESDLRGALDEELARLGRFAVEVVEAEAHRAFAHDRVEVFVGRADVLERIAGYLRDPGGQPLMVHGPPGSGKTAVLARAGLDASRDAKAAVLIRFAAATPTSSDWQGLLQGLCREIGHAFADPRPVPTEPIALAQDFVRRLALATADQSIVLFLDALDQLSPAGGAHELDWLPYKLPPHVGLVASVSRTTHEDNCFQAARRRGWENLAALGPMTVDEGGRLLDAWLGRAGRRLQPDQRERVLAGFAGNGLPLYLKLAFEEARRWKSHESPPLAADVTGVLEGMLARLEEEGYHGHVLASRALGYLAAGRFGLTEDELLDVLSDDPEVMHDFRRRSPRSPRVQRLPVLIWSRLLADVEPYMTTRGEDGTAVLTFYHRQVAEAVASRNLAKSAVAVHRRLARYFGAQPFGSAAAPNLRKLSELPHHQTRGQLWDELNATLASEEFLRAMQGTGRTADLVAAHDAAIDAVAVTRDLARLVTFAFARARLRDRLAPDAAILGHFRDSGRQTAANSTAPDVVAFLAAARQSGYLLLRMTCQDPAGLPAAFTEAILSAALEADEGLRWESVAQLLTGAAGYVPPDALRLAVERCVALHHPDVTSDAFRHHVVVLLTRPGLGLVDFAIQQALSIRDPVLREDDLLGFAEARAEELSPAQLGCVLAAALPSRFTAPRAPEVGPDQRLLEGIILMEQLPQEPRADLLRRCAAAVPQDPERALIVGRSVPRASGSDAWCAQVWTALAEKLSETALERIACRIWEDVRYKQEEEIAPPRAALVFRILLPGLERAFEGKDATGLVAYLVRIGLADEVGRLATFAARALAAAPVTRERLDQCRQLCEALGAASPAVAVPALEQLFAGLAERGTFRDQVFALAELAVGLGGKGDAALLARAADLGLTFLTERGTRDAMHRAGLGIVAALAAASEEAMRESALAFAAERALEIADPDLAASVRLLVIRCSRAGVLSDDALGRLAVLTNFPARPGAIEIELQLELARSLARAGRFQAARQAFRSACERGIGLPAPKLAGAAQNRDHFRKSAAFKKAVDVCVELPDLRVEPDLRAWTEVWSDASGLVQNAAKRFRERAEPAARQEAQEQEVQRNGHASGPRASGVQALSHQEPQHVYAALWDSLSGDPPDAQDLERTLREIWRREAAAVGTGQRGSNPGGPPAGFAQALEGMHGCDSSAGEPWERLDWRGRPNWTYLRRASDLARPHPEGSAANSGMLAMVLHEVSDAAWAMFAPVLAAVAEEAALDQIEPDGLAALCQLLAVRDTPPAVRERLLRAVERDVGRPRIPALLLAWAYQRGTHELGLPLCRSLVGGGKEDDLSFPTTAVAKAAVTGPDHGAGLRPFLDSVARQGGADAAVEAAVAACRSLLAGTPDEAARWFRAAVGWLPRMSDPPCYLSSLVSLLRLAGHAAIPADAVGPLVEHVVSLPRNAGKAVATMFDYPSTLEKIRAGVFLEAFDAVQRRSGDAVPWAERLMRAALEPPSAGKSALDRLREANPVKVGETREDAARRADMIARLFPRELDAYAGRADTEQSRQHRADSVDLFWQTLIVCKAAEVGLELASQNPDLARRGAEARACAASLIARTAEACPDLALYWAIRAWPGTDDPDEAHRRLVQLFERLWSLEGMPQRQFHLLPQLRRRLKDVGTHHPVVPALVEQLYCRNVWGNTDECEFGLRAAVVALADRPDELAAFLGGIASRLGSHFEPSAPAWLAESGGEIDRLSPRLLEVVWRLTGLNGLCGFVLTAGTRRGMIRGDDGYALLAGVIMATARNDLVSLLRGLSAALAVCDSNAVPAEAAQAIGRELAALAGDDPVGPGRLLDALCKGFPQATGGNA